MSLDILFHQCLNGKYTVYNSEGGWFVGQWPLTTTSLNRT